MVDRITELQQIIKTAKQLHLNSDLLDYSGLVEYYPEELVISVRAGTKITDIQSELAKHNQVLPFFVENAEQSIGTAYACGGQDISDSVLGVQIIDGTGEVLNFGGQVIKNVAGYDVARLLVGSKGKLALITQISFKVMPNTYVGKLNAPVKTNNNSTLRQQIEQKLKAVFDPRGVFE